MTKVARGKKVDMDYAITAARTVLERGDWPQAPPAEHKAVLCKFIDLMEQHHEGLVLLETLDTGKPIRHSLRDDIPGAVRVIRWYAEVVGKVYGEAVTTPMDDPALAACEPVGVIVATVPWNLPLLLACWKLSPALTADSSVILRPSEKSPLTIIRLATSVRRVGSPDGIFSIVSGYGHEVGRVLSQRPDADVVTFIDSTCTGKRLLKDTGGSNMKRVWPEAGGRSANTAFVDCLDLPRAAANAAIGIFYNQNQVCIAGTRLLLEESIVGEFIALLKEQVKDWQPDNPPDSGITMDTLIDNVYANTADTFIHDDEAQSAPTLDSRSHVYSVAIGPTTSVDAVSQVHVGRDEAFGPVLVATRSSSEAEVLALADGSNYGLGTTVRTRDPSHTHRTSCRLRAGPVFVNSYNDDNMTMSFDGYKQNGNGRGKSLHALEKSNELKIIWTFLKSQS